MTKTVRLEFIKIFTRSVTICKYKNARVSCDGDAKISPGSKWYQLAAGDRAATQQALLTATGGKR